MQSDHMKTDPREKRHKYEMPFELANIDSALYLAILYINALGHISTNFNTKICAISTFIICLLQGHTFYYGIPIPNSVTYLCYYAHIMHLVSCIVFGWTS